MNKDSVVDSEDTFRLADFAAACFPSDPSFRSFDFQNFGVASNIIVKMDYTMTFLPDSSSDLDSYSYSAFPCFDSFQAAFASFAVAAFVPSKFFVYSMVLEIRK